MKLILLNHGPSGIHVNTATEVIRQRLVLVGNADITKVQDDGAYVACFGMEVDGLNFCVWLQAHSVMFGMYDTTPEDLPAKLMQLLPRLNQEVGASTAEGHGSIFDPRHF